MTATGFLIRQIGVVLFIGLLCGCTAHHYSAHLGSTKESLKTGRDCRSAWLEQQIFDGPDCVKPDVDPLYLLEMGTVYAVRGEFERSNTVLEVAFEKYTKNEMDAVINARETTTAFLDITVSEGSGEYELTDYEKIYLHSLKAENHLMLGDIEKARIEAMRAIERHKRVEENTRFKRAQVETLPEMFEKKYGIPVKQEIGRQMDELSQKASLDNEYRMRIKNIRNSYENGYTYLTNALILGLNGESGSICQQLEAANEVAENNFVKKLYEGCNTGHDPVTEPNVYIFAKVGFAPEQKNFSLPFYNPVSQTITQFSIARSIPEKAEITGLEILPNDAAPIALEPITDFDRLAMRQYQDDLPLNITRSIIRVVSQTAIDKSLIARVNKENETEKESKKDKADKIARIISSAKNILLSKADTRCWNLCPQQVLFFSGVINEDSFVVRINSASGRSYTQYIDISPDKLNIISLWAYDPKSYLHVSHLDIFDKLQVVWRSVNIRNGPSTSDKIIAQVKHGDRLKKISKNGNWYKILLASGKEGFIYGKAVKAN